MATHGGGYLSQSDLQKAGQGMSARFVLKMAHRRKDEQSPIEKHTENNKAIGHVAGQEQEDKKDEPTVPPMG